MHIVEYEEPELVSCLSNYVSFALEQFKRQTYR